MNMNLLLSKPVNPLIGNMYYDVDNNMFFLFNGITWQEVDVPSNSKTIENFIWKNEISLQIMKYTWWLRNKQNILNWMDLCSIYPEVLDTGTVTMLVFENTKDANWFKLKWESYYKARSSWI